MVFVYRRDRVFNILCIGGRHMKRKGDLVLGVVFGVMAVYYVARAIASISLFAIPKLCFSIVFCVLAIRFLQKYFQGR